MRDFCQVKEIAREDSALGDEVLQLFAIDNEGLEEHDRELLTLLLKRFGGKPVGLSSLASAMGEDKGTIEDVYEPYLVKTGFVSRTPSGRVATDKARAHLGFPVTEE